MGDNLQTKFWALGQNGSPIPGIEIPESFSSVPKFAGHITYEPPLLAKGKQFT